MVLFHLVVEISACAMDNLATRYPVYCACIGVVPVSGYSRRLVANHILSLCEGLLGRCHVSLFGKHRIHQVSISVNGSVKVVPFAADLDLSFINVPGTTSLALASGSELFRDKGSEVCFPVSDCFMSKIKAAR